MEETGRLHKIWIKRFNRGPMDERREALMVEGRGLQTNANQGGKRQVTLLSLEAWRDVERELEAGLDPSLRRANLLVSGVQLKDSLHRVLRIGECRLKINGETRPCERMDEARQGLQQALCSEWRGGAYAEVLEGGRIRVDDPVNWEPAL